MQDRFSFALIGQWRLSQTSYKVHLQQGQTPGWLSQERPQKFLVSSSGPQASEASAPAKIHASPRPQEVWSRSSEDAAPNTGTRTEALRADIPLLDNCLPHSQGHWVRASRKCPL